MIYWKPFELQGKLYDLSHLHPRIITYLQPAREKKPEQKYKVRAIFNLHCFTRGQKENETPDPALYYSDNREQRIFDFVRYNLSLQLPGIVESFMSRQCYHTGKGNFLVIELSTGTGKVQNYEIYFNMFIAADNTLTLRIESAYLRDEEHWESRPKKHKIGFGVILSNTKQRKPIKLPK